MEETQKRDLFNIIAGVIFGILALWWIIEMVAYQYYEFYSVVCKLCYIGMSVALFMKKKIILTISATVLAITELIFFIKYITTDIPILYLISVTFPLMIAYVLIVLLAVDEKHFKKIWFLPAVFRAIPCIYNIIGGIIDGYLIYNILSDLWNILNVLAFLFACMWLAGKTIKVRVNEGTNAATAVPENAGYCSLAKHVLLLLFTFGIWQLIWVYKSTSYLNCVEDEEYRNPTTKLLLCMFVPFYSIFWIYKSAQRIDKLAKTKNIQSDLSTVCLILAIFIPFVAYIIMQDKINAVATAKN